MENAQLTESMTINWRPPMSTHFQWQIRENLLGRGFLGSKNHIGNKRRDAVTKST